MTAHLPNNPVGSFDKTVGFIVNLRCFVKNLPKLRDSPLRGNLSAVELEPILIHLFGNLIKLRCLSLRRMMLPKLNISVRLILELINKAKRCAVLLDRHNRTCGKIESETDNVLRINSALFYNIGNSCFEHVEIVLRVLKCPVGSELFAARKLFVHNGMRIIENRGCKLLTCFDVDEQCSARESAEINADCIFCHNKPPFYVTPKVRRRYLNKP